MTEWPNWWNYGLVFSPHAIERMEERGVSEIDVRAMLDDATEFRESSAPSRFFVVTSYRSDDWEIIVKPDDLEQELIIVTLYRVE